jgi:hypothetical protein
MNSVTRRWWLLAIAGAPIVLGITAQALVVRVDDKYLRVNAPNLHFLTGKPLSRIRDGRTVGYLGQLSILTGEFGPVQSWSFAHFAVSRDIWEEDPNAGFKVTLVSPDKPSNKKLSAIAAEAWCLDQLKIELTRVPADRPIWIRLEIRSEDPKENAGIIDTPGISLSRLIELFSHPMKDETVRVTEKFGPLKVDDLRKSRL